MSRQNKQHRIRRRLKELFPERNKAKNTDFRMWKSGKKWLYASSSLILLMGSITPIVSPLIEQYQIVDAATSVTNTLTPGATISTPDASGNSTANISVNYQTFNPYTNSAAGSMNPTGSSAWAPTTIQAKLGDAIGVTAPGKAVSDSNTYDYSAPSAPAGYTFNSGGSVASLTSAGGTINVTYAAKTTNTRVFLTNAPGGNNVYGPMFNNNGSAGVTGSYGVYNYNSTPYSNVNASSAGSATNVGSNAYATYVGQSYGTISGFPTDNQLSVAGYTYSVQYTNSSSYLSNGSTWTGTSTYTTISSAEAANPVVGSNTYDAFNVIYTANQQSATVAYSYAAGTPGSGMASGTSNTSASAVPTLPSSLAVSGSTGDRLSFSATLLSGGGSSYSAATFTITDTTAGTSSAFTAPVGYTISAYSYAGSTYTSLGSLASAYPSLAASSNAVSVILTAYSGASRIYLYTQPSLGASLASGLATSYGYSNGAIISAVANKYYESSGPANTAGTGYDFSFAVGSAYAAMNGSTFPTDSALAAAAPGYTVTKVYHTNNNGSSPALAPGSGYGLNGYSYATMANALAANSYADYPYGSSTLSPQSGNGVNYWAVVYKPIAPTLKVNNVTVAQSSVATNSPTSYSSSMAWNASTANGAGTSGTLANFQVQTVDGASFTSLNTSQPGIHSAVYQYLDANNGQLVSSAAQVNVIAGSSVSAATFDAVSLTNQLNLSAGAIAPDSGTTPTVKIVSSPNQTLDSSAVKCDNMGNLTIDNGKLSQVGDYVITVTYTYNSKPVTVTDTIHITNPSFSLPYTGGAGLTGIAAVAAASTLGALLIRKRRKQEESNDREDLVFGGWENNVGNKDKKGEENSS